MANASWWWGSLVAAGVGVAGCGDDARGVADGAGGASCDTTTATGSTPTTTAATGGGGGDGPGSGGGATSSTTSSSASAAGGGGHGGSAGDGGSGGDGPSACDPAACPSGLCSDGACADAVLWSHEVPTRWVARAGETEIVAAHPGGYAMVDASGVLEQVAVADWCVGAVCEHAITALASDQAGVDAHRVVLALQGRGVLDLGAGPLGSDTTSSFTVVVLDPQLGTVAASYPWGPNAQVDTFHAAIDGERVAILTSGRPSLDVGGAVGVVGGQGATGVFLAQLRIDSLSGLVSQSGRLVTQFPGAIPPTTATATLFPLHLRQDELTVVVNLPDFVTIDGEQVGDGPVEGATARGVLATFRASGGGLQLYRHAALCAKFPHHTSAESVARSDDGPFIVSGANANRSCLSALYPESTNFFHRRIRPRVENTIALPDGNVVLIGAQGVEGGEPWTFDGHTLPAGRFAIVVSGESGAYRFHLPAARALNGAAIDAEHVVLSEGDRVSLVQLPPRPAADLVD